MSSLKPRYVRASGYQSIGYFVRRAIGFHQLKLKITRCERTSNIAAKLRASLRTPYWRLINFFAVYLKLLLPVFHRPARTLQRFILERAKTSDRMVEQPDTSPLIVTFETTVAMPTLSSRLMDEAQKSAYSSHFPTEVISWSRDGLAFPLFAKEARGCRITDLEGREYIDYLMGFGCALLGYAHERVQRAVSEALDSAGMLSLTHYLEMDVIRLLCELIPCSEKVLFGKNGSDVCTAAVRLARSPHEASVDPGLRLPWMARLVRRDMGVLVQREFPIVALPWSCISPLTIGLGF